MKLLKPESCPPLSGVGNTKRWTMIVEGRGIGFWTRVRLPPTPLQHERSNPFSTAKIGVLRSTACITVDMNSFPGYKSTEKETASYTRIRQWIKDEYGICVSNLALSQAKDALGIAKEEYKGRQASGKYKTPGLKEEKLEVIKAAFEYFDIL